MRFNKSDIKKMAVECLSVLKNKGMLNEISMQDAFNKFYMDKIYPQEWAVISNGVQNMTPFHKAALDIIANCGDMNTRANIVRLVATTWDRYPDLRKTLADGAKNKSFTDPETLNKFVETVVNSGAPQTKGKRAEKGLVVLFENDKVLVTCTTSYSASKKYYGDTHWCTASGVDGELSGFKMFKQYTEDGYFLLQFVPKEDRTLSFQAQVSSNGYIEVVFDYYDTERYEPDFSTKMFEYGLDIDEFLGNIDYDMLIDETEKNCSEEEKYWTKLDEEYTEKARNELIACIKSDKFFELVKAVTNYRNGGKKEEYLQNIAGKLFISNVLNNIPCGTIVTKVAISNFVRWEEAEKTGIFTRNAYNYITRAEQDDDTSGDILILIYLFDKDLNNIATYFGWNIHMCKNVMWFNQGDPTWDGDEERTFVSLIDGQELAKGYCHLIGNPPTQVEVSKHEWGQKTVVGYIDPETGKMSKQSLNRLTRIQ